MRKGGKRVGKLGNRVRKGRGKRENVRKVLEKVGESGKRWEEGKKR